MFGSSRKHDHRHFLLWSPLELRTSSFLDLSRGRSMKPLFPSSYEVSHARPRVLKSASNSLLLLYRYSGYWYDVAEQQSSAAAAAVLFNQAQEVTQTTSTTVARARAPSKNFLTDLDVTAEEKATAPQLEPAFEALFRCDNVHEDVILACRV